MNDNEEEHTLLQKQTAGVRTLLGAPQKAIIRLSIPMIVAMSVHTLYNFVDAIWVSGLGADALSAVGFFFPFMFIIMALAAGLGLGGGSAVSRRIGAHDKPGADLVASHTMVLMIITSTALCVPSYIAAPKIFKAMGAGPISPLATQYARILFAGMLVYFFSNIATSLMRAEGDVKRAMISMIVGGVLNIILDPIFIYVLDLGVKGAAWATLVSVAVSSAMLFYWLCIKKVSFISLSFKRFRFNRMIIKDIYRVGIPSSIQHLMMAVSVFVFNVLCVRAGGTDGVAVYTAGWRVVMFSLLPLFGIATAVTSVTGAAYGGKDYQKLKTAFWYAVKVGFYIELVAGGLTFLLAPHLAVLFTFSEGAIRIRSDLIVFLRLMCIYYPFTPLGIMSSSMFQGTGKGSRALVVTLVRTIILAVPLAYTFAFVLDLGLPGLWWGIVAGNVLGAAFAFSWANIFVRGLLSGLEKPISKKNQEPI